MDRKQKIKPTAWEEFILKLNKLMGREKIICGSCSFDWRGSCHRPERHNAVWCPDYEKRGQSL